MRLRSIRSRVLVLIMLPLLSLIVLYSFATALTAGDAITLARAQAIRNEINDPVGLFQAQVQTERLLGTMYPAGPTPQGLGALQAQEATTDKYLSALRTVTSSPGTRSDLSPQGKAVLAVLIKDTASLASLRHAISTDSISRSLAQQRYSAMIAASYNLLIQTVLEMPSAPLETQALAVMRLTEGADILLQEQALFAGDVMARSFPASDHLRFAELVGERRGLISEAMPALNSAIRQTYGRFMNPQAAAELTGLEDAVINTRAGIVPRVPVTAYLHVASAVAGGIDFGGYMSGPILSNMGGQAARPVDLRLAVGGGLGLFAIFVSIIASIAIGRGLVRELGGLKRAARHLADVHLPQGMARLSSSVDVDVDVDVEV